MRYTKARGLGAVGISSGLIVNFCMVPQINCFSKLNKFLFFFFVLFICSYTFSSDIAMFVKRNDD